MLLKNKKYIFRTQKGLNKKIVLQISEQKNEPGWMTDFRLKALDIFEQKPMPLWGADLTELDPNDIFYYVKPIESQHTDWKDVPEQIKKTFDRLGIPQAEQKFLAGVGAQFESEIIYKNLKKKWADQGVLFMDISTALREHEALVKKYFQLLFHHMTINLQHLILLCGVEVVLCMFLLECILICHCKHILE